MREFLCATIFAVISIFGAYATESTDSIEALPQNVKLERNTGHFVDVSGGDHILFHMWTLFTLPVSLVLVVIYSLVMNG